MNISKLKDIEDTVNNPLNKPNPDWIDSIYNTLYAKKAEYNKAIAATRANKMGDILFPLSEMDGNAMATINVMIVNTIMCYP